MLGQLSLFDQPPNEMEELRAFADWLIAMDDAENEVGQAERRRITLSKIIDRARKARGLQ